MVEEVINKWLCNDYYKYINNKKYKEDLEQEDRRKRKDLDVYNIEIYTQSHPAMQYAYFLQCKQFKSTISDLSFSITTHRPNPLHRSSLSTTISYTSKHG